MILSTQDSMLIGFFIGMLVGGWFSSWFIKRLIKKGYAKFGVTKKFMDEMEKNN